MKFIQKKKKRKEKTTKNSHKWLVEFAYINSNNLKRFIRRHLHSKVDDIYPQMFRKQIIKK